MKTHIPRLRHKKLKNLGKNLYLCTDKRSTDEAKFEGSSGGGGYHYYGYENPKPKIDKHTVRVIKYSSRKAISSNLQTDSKRLTGIGDNG